MSIEAYQDKPESFLVKKYNNCRPYQDSYTHYLWVRLQYALPVEETLAAFQWIRLRPTNKDRVTWNIYFSPRAGFPAIPEWGYFSDMRSQEKVILRGIPMPIVEQVLVKFNYY